MKASQIARRIWPLSPGKLAELVGNARIELSLSRRGPSYHKANRRKLRRRMAVAYHAMRLWRDCARPVYHIDIKFMGGWAVLAECQIGEAQRPMQRDAAIALLRYYRERLSWPLRLVKDIHAAERQRAGEKPATRAPRLPARIRYSTGNGPKSAEIR